MVFLHLQLVLWNRLFWTFDFKAETFSTYLSYLNWIFSAETILYITLNLLILMFQCGSDSFGVEFSHRLGSEDVLRQDGHSSQGENHNPQWRTRPNWIRLLWQDRNVNAGESHRGDRSQGMVISSACAAVCKSQRFRCFSGGLGPVWPDRQITSSIFRNLKQFFNNVNLPNSIKVGSTFWQILNEPLIFCQRRLKNLPKCCYFPKSGHTGWVTVVPN